jgi:hypothetical protein
MPLGLGDLLNSMRQTKALEEQAATADRRKTSVTCPHSQRACGEDLKKSCPHGPTGDNGAHEVLAGTRTFTHRVDLD